jgi:hypothetical protein
MNLCNKCGAVGDFFREESLCEPCARTTHSKDCHMNTCRLPDRHDPEVDCDCGAYEKSQPHDEVASIMKDYGETFTAIKEHDEKEGWEERIAEWARALWRQREFDSEIEAEEALIESVRTEIAKAREEERQRLLPKIKTMMKREYLRGFLDYRDKSLVLKNGYTIEDLDKFYEEYHLLNPDINEDLLTFLQDNKETV